MRILVPVGHDDMSTVRFNLGFSQYLTENLDVKGSNHQERLTEGTTTFSQHLVRI